VNGQGISLIERMRIIVIRRTWRICPDRKSGLFWGSESSLTRKPSPTNCLDVRHTVVHDFERLIDGPLFGSLLGEPLIEAPTSERLFLRCSAQVHPEGVVGPHDLGFEFLAVVLILRIFSFHRSLISRM